MQNEGNGNFAIENLPGGITHTRALAVSDLDNDGNLDIIVGNHDQPNNYIYRSICSDGGAQLHSQSWCFSCPPFMGRDTFFGGIRAICVECKPDHLQSDGSEQCSRFPCPVQQRKLGEDFCSSCPGGTFYANNVERNEDEESW